MNHAYRVTLIKDFAEARRLAAVWDALYERTTGATPWQSWHWFEAWWTSMRGDAALCLVLVEDETDGSPVLLLPLQRRIDRMLGLPVRILEPLGMPDEINRPRLALGECSPAALFAALAALQDTGSATRGPGWDMLRLDEVTTEDWATEPLKAFSRRRNLGLHCVTQHPCPYLDLRQDWDTFLAGRGKKLAKNLRAAARRLETSGPLALQVAQTPAEIDEGFTTLLSIHECSWKQQAGIGFARGEGYAAYYRRFLSAMAVQGRARLLVLKAGEVAVAAAIGVTDGRDYYGAQIVHDSRYDQCSPGTLLEAMELEALMREQRFRYYDFFGAALNNKRRWTDTCRNTERWLLIRATPVTQLIRAYYFAFKPSVQRLRPYLGLTRPRAS
ncbi:MAG: GNAT family N-acetyltransferase [Ectothiorhodospiraceae bacterium]|nr:GNAT family N-acetyltransferase [Ectothiorhodospiraceae bacterium]